MGPPQQGQRRGRRGLTASKPRRLGDPLSRKCKATGSGRLLLGAESRSGERPKPLAGLLEQSHRNWRRVRSAGYRWAARFAVSIAKVTWRGRRRGCPFPGAHTVQVAAQIDQGLFPRADVLTVDDPLLGMAFRQVQSGLGHGRKQFGRNTLAIALWLEQIALAGLGAPPLLLGIDGGGGHDHMHVGW